MFLKYAYRLLTIFFLIVAASGCHQLDGVGTTLHEDGSGALKKITVTPIRQVSGDEAAAGIARCPICGSTFRVDKLTDRPEKMVENIFIEHLARYEAFRLIPFEGFQSVNDSDMFDRDTLKKIGGQLGVDGVIVGYVYRYREWVGYPYAVKQPASVSFHIHLLRVDDGVMVWKGEFDKTQKSLMENMLQLPFFYRERGRWLTAEELTEEGVGEILKTFPGIR